MSELAGAAAQGSGGVVRVPGWLVGLAYMILRHTWRRRHGCNLSRSFVIVFIGPERLSITSIIDIVVTRDQRCRRLHHRRTRHFEGRQLRQAVGASLQNVRHYMHFLCTYHRTEGMTITGAVKRLCALNLQKMSHNMARWL